MIEPVGVGKYLDLGCGLNKKEGYIGVDKTAYEGVDLQQDLRFTQLPFKSQEIDGVYTSHFLEHLTFEENLWLFNEIYRILKTGGVFDIIVPHGFSYSGMADLSHKTFWTEDTFGYFSPDNRAFYEWEFTDPNTNKKQRIINNWQVEKNDTTPPYEYTIKGWVELKLREIHAILKKLP